MPSNPPVPGVGRNRREFLKLAGAAGIGGALAPTAIVRALASSPPSQTITMTGVAAGYGQYMYFPFTVPAAPEVNRIDVSVVHDVNNSNVVKLGAGLFDQRGAQYQSPGFRGVYGEERSQFFVSAESASQSFIPGTILPGTWTVVVPVFLATVPTNVTVTVTLNFGKQGQAFVPGKAQEGIVRPARRGTAATCTRTRRRAATHGARTPRRTRRPGRGTQSRSASTSSP
ncbi:MAG TPA: twin-arginine translocation signal domain-containing protein [Candidatus Angelobacter sp.]|nr:twin-arginine translocation signal domain-containing protein [Candidatus Angelobacter sp.]